MKKTSVLLFLIFLIYNADAQTIKINPQIEIATVSPLFWGANFLNWIEDDAALKDGKILNSLKKMPCRVLRYPGGTIADNFNWKTSTLENPNMFPFESGETESNFDEFMSFCKKVGAEPLLVVNTQTWFMKDKINEGAQYAADWVKYCNEKGYHVKFWEIGNETYWHPIMTAKEYGQLVNVYSSAMRKADPDILISANGHWDINMVGTKERTDSSQWDQIKEGYNSIASKEDYRRLKEFSDGVKEKDVSIGENKWWNDLISVCGDNIDMISVHWYFHKNVLSSIDKKINELKSFLKTKKPEKNYLLCLSEFNCNDSDTEDRVSGFAESIGRFLTTEVYIATFWPLRINGMEQRSMLTLDDKTPQYPYQIFSLFSRLLQGNMIECQSPQQIYSFASKSGSEITAVISGRLLKESTPIVIDIPQKYLFKKEISAVGFRGSTMANSVVIKEYPVEISEKKEDLYLIVEPKSFIVIVIR